MRVDHHDFHHEFPEFKDRISALKVSDAHFAKLFSEYDALDKEIRHLEEANSPTSDAHLETLKLKRVHLKDQLYHRLKA